MDELLDGAPELKTPERKGPTGWGRLGERAPTPWRSSGELVGDRLSRAEVTLTYCVEVNSRKMHGVPLLKGTRFPVAQVLSQIADGDSIDDLAENFDLDREQLASLLHAFSAYLDKPIHS